MRTDLLRGEHKNGSCHKIHDQKEENGRNEDPGHQLKDRLADHRGCLDRNFRCAWSGWHPYPGCPLCRPGRIILHRHRDLVV